jgi:sirohydrochlorin cobaltochelatase
MNGIVVVGHGSRSREAFDVFHEVVAYFREKMGKPVEGCFMELSQPNIPDTINNMYEKGIRDIIVVPYFLYPGIHIKEDIPEILVQIKEKYSDLSISMAKPIGYNKSIIDILKANAEGELTCI